MNFNTSLLFFLQAYICQNRQCQFLYINKTKFKSQATVQKSDLKIFYLVTLSAIPWVSNTWTSSSIHYVVHLLYVRTCSFAQILNECNVTFPCHIKNVKEIRTIIWKIEDAKFY